MSPSFRAKISAETCGDAPSARIGSSTAKNPVSSTYQPRAFATFSRSTGTLICYATSSETESASFCARSPMSCSEICFFTSSRVRVVAAFLSTTLMMWKP